jgi:hypothetical protein
MSHITFTALSRKRATRCGNAATSANCSVAGDSPATAALICDTGALLDVHYRRPECW